MILHIIYQRAHVSHGNLKKKEKKKKRGVSFLHFSYQGTRFCKERGKDIERIENAGDLISGGNDILIACHILPTTRRKTLVALTASSSSRPRPALSGSATRSASCAYIRESKILILHLQVAYLFAAGPQYFPFSTISYEFSQYAINSKASHYVS